MLLNSWSHPGATLKESYKSDSHLDQLPILYLIDIARLGIIPLWHLNEAVSI